MGAPKLIKSIEMREADFRRLVNTYTKFNQQMRDDFVSYWTEPSRGGTKMRFELEKTWDTSRRLGTWDRNNFGAKSKQNLAPVVHMVQPKPVQNEPPAPKNELQQLEQVLAWYKSAPKKWNREALQSWPHLDECYQLIKKYRLWDQTITKADIEKIKGESGDEDYLKSYILHRTFEWYGTSGFTFSDTLNLRDANK